MELCVPASDETEKLVVRLGRVFCSAWTIPGSTETGLDHMEERPTACRR